MAGKWGIGNKLWTRLSSINCSRLAHAANGADICSFCPRDYANESRATAADVNNKPKQKERKAPKVFSDDFELEQKYR